MTYNVLPRKNTKNEKSAKYFQRIFSFWLEKLLLL